MTFVAQILRRSHAGDTNKSPSLLQLVKATVPVVQVLIGTGGSLVDPNPRKAQGSSETFWKERPPPVLSVLVHAKDPHTVQLWQLGDEYSEEGKSIEHKMDCVVFGVEAGEDVPEDGGRQKEKQCFNLKTKCTRFRTNNAAM